MTWPQLFASELSATVANPETWVAIGLALLLAAALWIGGAWVARGVGILDADAPAGESLAVGLVSGLMIVISCWAAIRSAGTSSFTPIAVGFVVALSLAVAARRREPSASVERGPTVAGRATRATIARTAVFSALFIVAIGLLYGSTIATAARDGVQPIIERDTAYYAILGRDLAATGTETNLGPSGFAGIAGLPGQIWYHWGEGWLASLMIATFGLGPMAARHFIALPLVLLAAAALAGTLVRRLAGTDSWRAFAAGFVVLLVLGPVATAEMTAMSSWAVGLLAGIAMYGAGAAAAIFAMYCVATLSDRRTDWGLATFVGTSVAFILPAHIALAVLAVVGASAVAGVRILSSLRSARTLPRPSTVWRRTLIATVAVTVGTVVWGQLTGHSLGGGGAAPAVIAPFSSGWQETVVRLAGGAGVFLAIPLAWWRSRVTGDPARDLYLGVVVLLVAGAIGWGARLSEFTMFYLLFAGIAVYASAIVAVALWAILRELLRTGHRAAGLLLVFLSVTQVAVSGLGTVLRLQALGVAQYEPIPTAILQSIEALPAGAKLAYACGPRDEISFGVPQLITIDAVTGRRAVPMCFEREYPSIILGAPRDITVPSQFFVGAPQMQLYPTATATPSPDAVREFFAKYQIEYIYADDRHPNTLIPDAVPVAASGDVRVLRVP